MTTIPKHSALLAGLLAVNVLTLGSQAPGPDAQQPAFEVASIKPNKTADGERGFGFQPGGRFVAKNVRLRELIAAAYGTPQPLPSFRIVGGPGWISSEPYDVLAKAANSFPETEFRPGWSTSGELMLRTLLADRFKLVVHRETRELPSYALVPARSDGRLGPQLRTSSGDDCVQAGAAGDGIRCGGFRGTPIRMSARFVTMDVVAAFVENVVARVVLNRTGLSGTFSLDLDFVRDTPGGEPPLVNGRPVEAPSIYTALPEQLGLKLESIRTPVEVIVIDSVDRPTAD